MNSSNNPMRGLDRGDFLIGVLSITAAIFFVSLLLVQWMPAPALGSGMTTYGGGFVMTVGALTVGDEEIVYLIDTSSQKMATYRFDTAKNQIVILQGVDLTTLQPATTTPRSSTQPPRSGQPPAQPARPAKPTPAQPAKPNSAEPTQPNPPPALPPPGQP